MKNLSIILLTILSIAGLTAQAQTKKPAKKATTTKTTPTKKTTTTPTSSKTTTNKPVETDEKTGVKPRNQTVKQTNANGVTANYKVAIGLKFIYGISATGKVFLTDKHALEGIVRYNGAGGLGSNIAFTALYEYHNNIKEVEGLRWFIGGGGHVNHFSWKDSNIDGVTSFGISGVVGLEYKIKTLPFAISADWVPGYMLSPSSGFSAENGGIGIKYTF
ncbi:hypothetical protein [Pedobacter sp. UC225_65]|uniref:hypothetical protein n=1 Tax=Pedobacter sp. UC225_65 TaxID=3350173 RepID=UPI00367039B2